MDTDIKQMSRRSLENEVLSLRRQVAQLERAAAARHESDKALAECEEKYHSTMESALVGIYVIQDLQFKYVNPTMAGFFGFRPEEMVDRLGPLDMLIPEQRDQVGKNLQRRAHGEEGRPYEIVCLRKDGTTFDAMVWGKGITYNGRPASVGTLMDVSNLKAVQRRLEDHRKHLQERVSEQTEKLRLANRHLQHDIKARIEAEEALRISEGRLRSLINATENDLVMLFDHERRVVIANERSARTFDRATPELIGADFLELVAEESRDECGQRLSEVLAKGESKRIEKRLGDHWYDINLCPVPGPEGGSQAMAMFARDITHRKLIEQAFEKAKEDAERANRAKTRFLAAANHDLRQPLQALSLLLSAIAYYDMDDQAQRVVKDMKSTLLVMESLLNSLLDISKLEAGTIIPDKVHFAAQPFLQHLQTQFKGQAGERNLDLRVVSVNTILYTDPVLLGRILQNYISNAIRHARGDRIIIGCRPAGKHRRFEVWNAGEGIPDDEQERIFEEFYQLGNPARNRNQGLGLGLAIAKRMADLLGLDLGVRSIVGKGVVFSVDVPCGERAQPLQHDAGSEQPIPQKKQGQGTILVVDDDESVLYAMERLLHLWGFKVLSTGRAETALQLIERNTATEIRCVLLDYRLPEGWNGVSLHQEMCKRAGYELQTILVTGDTAAKKLREVEDSGLPLLHKPVNPNDLYESIQRLINERRQQ